MSRAWLTFRVGWAIGCHMTNVTRPWNYERLLESQRIYAQEKSAEFSQKSRASSMPFTVVVITNQKLCDRTEEMEIVWKKHTTRTWDFFESHRAESFWWIFDLFFLSYFSPNAGASCVLFALLLSSWPGLTCHVKQFLAFYIRSLPRALDSTAKVSQAVIVVVVFRGAFLCEPVQGISNISNSPH